jgi:hypothetical protein
MLRVFRSIPLCQHGLDEQFAWRVVQNEVSVPDIDAETGSE